MGILSSILDAAKEANEDAHGARLLKETNSSFSCLENLDERVQYNALLGYIQIQDRIIAQMHNWSREGRIKLARSMQIQARQAFDSDMSGGYAKWFAGAWLESKERTSISAQQAHSLLEQLAANIRQED